MRIVIDGAAGSGKTTFLSCDYYNPRLKMADDKLPNIKKFGYTVFSELIQSSLNEAKEEGILPPKNQDYWNRIFEIMFARGVEQYNGANEDEIYWYDRGIPFISAFAIAHGVSVSQELFQEFGTYVYDYVFVFEPIKEYDLSGEDNGRLKRITLEDRYNEYKLTADIYRKLGNKVYEVPVFSQDLEENFWKRYQYIKTIIPELR